MVFIYVLTSLQSYTSLSFYYSRRVKHKHRPAKTLIQPIAMALELMNEGRNVGDLTVFSQVLQQV